LKNKTTKKQACAVIPAAGRGSRLGEEIPKILIPIAGEKTVWHILYEKLRLIVDHIHVVLSPEGILLFRQQLEMDRIPSGVSSSIQETPLGMGDAIFGAFDYWKDYENILILWGDQIAVSKETLEKTVTAQIASAGTALTIPVNLVDEPYVQYIFDEASTSLIKVRQTREGDICDKRGLADVGVFGLSNFHLMDAWKDFCKNASEGEKTGEINFLPFLPYLSADLGWNLKTVPVTDPTESRGINTPDDLFFFRDRFSKERKLQ
jgi:bifunctional UDP-N-acetylglucosamine pyrophosphorylase / glucosamine-1-phosphate N-acetyltransferase